MNNPEYGAAYYVSATGTIAITSANAQIIGVLFAGTATGGVQFFAGVTVSASISPPILVYSTVTGNTANGAIYVPYPAYASGGFSVKARASLDPKLVIFWNPLSGT